ncbi:MAG: MarR family winged helix-turn-helix transcriptional regulator [Pyrinomonadaceae bacterium]
MNIENSLVYLLTNFVNKFRAKLETSMNEIGLHSGQVFVLISLWKNNGQNQINLAQNLNLAAPTVNKMVKNLVDNDFVSCQKCGEDGRMMRVYLTTKGRKSEGLVKGQWQKIELASFANLTETEKLIFSQLLIKLRANFDK